MTMESLPQFEEVDVRKYLQVLQRRWLPAVGVCGVVITLASVVAITIKPNYQAEGSLLIKANRTASITGVGENLGRLDGVTANNNPLVTQARIITSNPILQKTIDTLNIKDNKGKPISTRDFSKQLVVADSVGSDVLQIAYKDTNPELAAKVVNTIIDVYIKDNIEANQEEALTALKFVKQQLPTAEASVRKAESELRQFKEKNRVVLLYEETAASVRTITELEGKITQAQAQLVNTDAKLQKLRSQAQVNPQEAVMSVELSQTPGVQKVLAQLQEAESQLKLENTRFQPGHPAIINLEEKVVALRSLLNQRTEQVVGGGQPIQQADLQLGQLRQGLITDITRAEAERSGLEKQIGTLINQWSAYKQRANYLPRLEQTQRELERKLKAAQGSYETLLSKLQEINIAENQRIANARVVSYAQVPTIPQGPRRILFIIAGGAGGLFIGLIVAFGLDLTDRSVKTVKEAKDVLKYTLLGVIPALGRNGTRNSKNHSSVAGIDRPLPQIIGRDVPHFPFGNAYQILQANLKFLCSDKKLKSLVVTSSVAKEGKSEVAANLAVAMAQLGRRVLLVDADMRRPIQHHVWELTNALGLSNMIVDQEISIENVVQEVMPYLDVLSSGVVPPNPMTLLDSQRMASLIENFSNHYDFVIFDTPPLAGTADAAILSNLTDGILLVVRPGVVDLNSANSAKEFLTQSGQNVLGIVINGVNVKSEPDSYFYYTSYNAEPSSTTDSLTTATSLLSASAKNSPTSK
ncbi:MAG: polysaccharide biosynthesis tyrosine autokinase [Scytonematopsis contorta HA4267-MV1]|nr:polysaccharide biosynthesis tyrosine autokinase [Scytonematopsis contorta HA4267-MV1]